MNTETLNSTISSGENEKVEFKAKIPKQDVISRHLASFANTAGGTLFFGVQKPGKIVGADLQKVKAAIDAALRPLSEEIKIEYDAIKTEEGTIVSVSIPKSDKPVAVHGSYYARSGSTTRPMKAHEIEEHVSQENRSESFSKFTKALELQTLEIEKLRKELERANSPKSKIVWAIIGAVPGAFWGLFIG